MQGSLAPKNKDKARAVAEQTHDALNVQETAGRVVSLHTTTTFKTYNDWNADTGATSHMAPHRQWLLDYKPYVVPIRLADNTIVYSAGVGSVVFNPIIKGEKCCPVQFTRVLHVPMLRHNLLSVLFLTRQRKFDVHIDANFINFILNGTRLFVASINDDNSAFLDGSTQPQLQFAKITSTLPLNYELWHRRLAHVNHNDVKKLIAQELVTGIKLDSRIAPDPICEPCLAGKMKANPFPATGHIAAKPLDLIHINVHGPVPVQSHSDQVLCQICR